MADIGGRITISRTTSNRVADYITIKIRGDGREVVAEMSLEDFATALTGFAMRPCGVANYEFPRVVASESPRSDTTET